MRKGFATYGKRVSRLLSDADAALLRSEFGRGRATDVSKSSSGLGKDG